MNKIKDRVRQIVLVPMIALVVVSSAACGSSHSDCVEGWSIVSYTVRSGDCLWDLGCSVTSGKCNIQEWIHSVKLLNGMRSDCLYAGEVIQIYVPIGG